MSQRCGAGRIWTFGLSFLDHPELSMQANTLGEAQEARSTLFSLASLVITTNARLRAGDAIDLGHQVVRLEPYEHGQLEVLPHPRGGPGPRQAKHNNRGRPGEEPGQRTGCTGRDH